MAPAHLVLHLLLRGQRHTRPGVGRHQSRGIHVLLHRAEEARVPGAVAVAAAQGALQRPLLEEANLQLELDYCYIYLFTRLVLFIYYYVVTDFSTPSLTLASARSLPCLTTAFLASASSPPPSFVALRKSDRARLSQNAAISAVELYDEGAFLLVLVLPLIFLMSPLMLPPLLLLLLT